MTSPTTIAAGIELEGCVERKPINRDTASSSAFHPEEGVCLAAQLALLVSLEHQGKTAPRPSAACPKDTLGCPAWLMAGTNRIVID